MDTELLEKIEKSFSTYQTSQAKALEPMVATLNDTNALIRKVFEGDILDAKGKVIKQVDPREAAKVEDIIPKAVSDFPWVALGVSGATSVLATELIDGFLAPKVGSTPEQIQTNALMRGGIKIAGAIAAFVYLKKVKIYGKDGATITAALVGFDGIRDIIPFDVWIKENIVARIVPPATAGLGRNPPVNTVQTSQVRASGSVMEF